MKARHYQPRLIEGIDIEADLISRTRKNLEVEAVQHTLPHMFACMAVCLYTLGAPVTVHGEEGFPQNASFTLLDFALLDSGPINHYDVTLWGVWMVLSYRYFVYFLYS